MLHLGRRRSEASAPPMIGTSLPGAVTADRVGQSLSQTVDVATRLSEGELSQLHRIACHRFLQK